MKKYILCFCMLIAVMSLSACGKSREAVVADTGSESSVAEDLTEDAYDGLVEDAVIEADLNEEISGDVSKEVSEGASEENKKDTAADNTHPASSENPSPPAQTEVAENSSNNEDVKPEVNPDNQSEDKKSNEEDTLKPPENITLKLYINGTQVPVTWENNATIDEMKEQVKSGDIVVAMSPYGGFEQVGSLGRSYTRNDSQTTTSSGDIVLYSGNQIVVFYGSNSWSYTRLGKMGVSADEAKRLLSGENVSLRITK